MDFNEGCCLGVWVLFWVGDFREFVVSLLLVYGLVGILCLFGRSMVRLVVESFFGVLCVRRCVGCF